jgi:uncharacterized protein (DUF1778 family)
VSQGQFFGQAATDDAVLRAHSRLLRRNDDVRELLGAAAAVRSSERTDYLERLNAEIERLLEDAALFVSQRASQSD